jgi:hypothetical protein
MDKSKAMNQSKVPPIETIALRASDRTPDGKNIIISLKTRYSSERAYSVPIECLFELIADLQRLNSPNGVVPDKQLDQSVGAAQQPKDQNQIRVTVPKKWMLRSGLPSHPLVIMIFDPQTETQTGFAITATAAREMAIGLVKYADNIAKFEAGKKKLS